MRPFLQMSCMEIPYLLLIRSVPDQHDANKKGEPQSELAGGDVGEGVHAASSDLLPEGIATPGSNSISLRGFSFPQ